MQDYVSEKTMALVIKSGKISAEVLEGAIKSFIKNTKKTVNKAKEKSATGKQSLKTLQKSGVSLSSVEITKDNIGDFDSVAKKYKMQNQKVPQIVRVIDGTAYTVNIHFKENAKESVRDKIMRLIRKEVETEMRCAQP